LEVGEKGANVAATLPKIGGCLPFVVDDEGTPVAFRRRAGVGVGKWGKKESPPKRICSLGGLSWCGA
jgi:hypothetical protein